MTHSEHPSGQPAERSYGALKVVQITTDNRVQHREHNLPVPYFGTAPQALLEGFAFLQDEVEVHVLSTTRHPLSKPLKLAGNIWFHEAVLPSWAMTRSLFTGAVWTLRKVLRNIQPDIVHGQGTERECALAAAFSGFPNVITIHGNMRVHARRRDTGNKLYYRLSALLEIVALKRTHGVVSISRYTDSLVRPLASRTWLLPNAAECRFFEARPSPCTPPVLLFVGSLDERKNPAGFIESCGGILADAGWRLRLCGRAAAGSAYAERMSMLAAKHPWVELVGWRTRAELLEEMQEASALVLPTLEDNCPMVVLEAMAAGLPVLASSVGGIPDLITDRVTGILFDPKDEDSMRHATTQMIANPVERTALARNAREDAWRRFHPRVVAGAHLQIYHELLGIIREESLAPPS